MPLYTSIGKYDLDLSVNGVDRTGTGAWDTADAIQFRDDMNLYGLHFTLPNGTEANVSIWKYWSTDTAVSHKGLVYETACTSLYLPLSVPISTNEALVVECTATEEKRVFLEVGRWEVGGGNAGITPLVNGTLMSGGGGGGGASSGTSTAHNMVYTWDPTATDVYTGTSTGEFSQQLGNTNGIALVRLVGDNALGGPHDDSNSAVRTLDVAPAYNQFDGPTLSIGTSNVAAGTYRSIVNLKRDGYTYYNVDYELDDITLELFQSNNTAASTAADTGWKLVEVFGTQTATGMYERDTPCGVDRFMLKYIATDASNDIKVRVTRFVA